MYKNIIIVLSVIFTLNCKAEGVFYYENLHPDSRNSIMIDAKSEMMMINGSPKMITYNCSGVWDYSEGKTWENGAKFISGAGNKVHILNKKLPWQEWEDTDHVIVEVHKRC